MKGRKNFSDPTADLAIGRVMKELKQKRNLPDYRDEPVASKRQVVPSWNEEIKKESNNA